MNLHKMIVFDYSQTLVYDRPLDVLKGVSAVLKNATVNPSNITVKELTELSEQFYYYNKWICISKTW